MAPSKEICIFCACALDVPQSGSRLKDDAKICNICSAACKDGTFCLYYHKDEDGWQKCGRCERRLHCGCIMALNSFELTDGFEIVCKECAEKPTFMPSDNGASSSAPNPVDNSQLDVSNVFEKPIDYAQLDVSSVLEKPVNYSQLDVSSVFEKLMDDEFLFDSLLDNDLWNPDTLLNNDLWNPDSLLNNDLSNPETVAMEANNNNYQLPQPELSFLFSKKLTATDCKSGPNRLLVPKHHAETFLPMPDRQQKMALDVKDTQGNMWNLHLCWWVHKKSRKYVLDGTRPCIETMNWKEGDLLKFYRETPSGDLVMELEKKPHTAADVGMHPGNEPAFLGFAGGSVQRN